MVDGATRGEQEAGDVPCPFCDELLHAMSDHLVIAPEGNADRRRHAHTECVLAARSAGTFRTYDDRARGFKFIDEFH